MLVSWISRPSSSWSSGAEKDVNQEQIKETDVRAYCETSQLSGSLHALRLKASSALQFFDYKNNTKTPAHKVVRHNSV